MNGCVECANKAVQIVAIEPDLIFYEQRLKDVLYKAQLDKPIFILSIVGAFRTGKSFLLSNFINYLNNDFKLDTKQPQQSRKSCVKNFDWTYGSSSLTKGIWIWNSPILIEDKYYVLPMDTQGIFDNTTSQNDSARIFSLSCLISSLLIYNLKSNLEKTHFEYLNLFSQFKLISDSKFKSKSSSTSSSTDGVKPLQLGLTILIRDWQYPDEHFYGMTGGEKYLHERLKPGKNSQASEFVDLVSDFEIFFKQRNCFLLPYPGSMIIRKDFSGDLTELDSEFTSQLENFFSSCLVTLNRNYADNSTLRSPENLFNLFRDYFQLIAAMPEAENNLESMGNIYKKHHNLSLKHNCVKLFKTSLNQLLSESDMFISEARLNDQHKILLNKCLLEFKECFLELDTHKFDMELRNFEHCLAKQFEYAREANLLKKKRILDDFCLTVVNEYKKSMEQYVNKSGDKYLKALDVAFQHQQVKLESLQKIKFKINADVAQDFNDILHKLAQLIDSELNEFDRKIKLNNAKIISKVKANSIQKYTSFMKEKINTSFHVDAEKLHEYHIDALDASINEFELLTQQNADLNNEYEMLVNDLRSIYLDYLIELNKNEANRKLKKHQRTLGNGQPQHAMTIESSLVPVGLFKNLIIEKLNLVLENCNPVVEGGCGANFKHKIVRYLSKNLPLAGDYKKNYLNEFLWKPFELVEIVFIIFCLMVYVSLASGMFLHDLVQNKMNINYTNLLMQAGGVLKHFMYFSFCFTLDIWRVFYSNFKVHFLKNN